jgi:hypothetical protein
MLLLGLGPAWLLVAAGAVFTFPRPGTGLVRFLFAEPPAAGSEGTVLWWGLLAIATAFALTTLLWGVGLLKLRRLVSFVAPEPPALAGGPLRCRCCGSDLEGPGPVLRCRSCRADHLLGAGATRPAEESLETALSRHESRLAASLAARAKGALRLLAAAGSAPVLVVVLSPLGLLAPGGSAALWLVPLVLFAAGLALLAAASRVAVPRIRTLDETARGDGVEIDGTTWAVTGVYRFGGLQPRSGLLALLSPDANAPVARALHVRNLAGSEELGLTVLELAEAAEAAAGSPAATESYPVSASKGSEWLAGPELNAVVRVHEGEILSIELHAGKAPVAGVVPVAALRAVAAPRESEVLLVASGTRGSRAPGS